MWHVDSYAKGHISTRAYKVHEADPTQVDSVLLLLYFISMSFLCLLTEIYIVMYLIKLRAYCTAAKEYYVT